MVADFYASIRLNTHAAVCNGHTGEITGLTRAERKRVTEICAEECGDIMTIISGVNCENTQESIEMALEAKEAGADGILLMPPHMWLRFGMNPNAPFEHIKDVAEGADIDIIIHLYPATSKAFYPVETLIKMCKEIPHVKCIKVGTRVTAIYEHDVRELRKHCPDVFLITCHDETLCVTWFTGMDGALIGFAGCVPELITGAWEVFSHPEKHTLKEVQDWSNNIYTIFKFIGRSALIYFTFSPSFPKINITVRRSALSKTIYNITVLELFLGCQVPFVSST